MDIVAADIGGTHARFAIARIKAGRVVAMDEPVTLKTSDHVSLEAAWQAFAERVGNALPDMAAIAVAAPLGRDVLKFTNSAWVVRPALVQEKLNLERCLIINDFVAVGYAAAQFGDDQLHHLCGPEGPLPPEGVISIVGPGTGLGVAQLLRRQGHDFVSGSEGGHIDFAPLDELEDAMLAFLRGRYRRVSVERIVSGPGLANIHEALARIEGRAVHLRDDTDLWDAALDGGDDMAAAALERFCLSLGSVAGDIALTHGAVGVVIGGGIGRRLAARLADTGFRHRFTAKGRFQDVMAAMPVKVITHPQPGLFGAAAAFAAQAGMG